MVVLTIWSSATPDPMSSFRLSLDIAGLQCFADPESLRFRRPSRLVLLWCMVRGAVVWSGVARREHQPGMLLLSKINSSLLGFRRDPEGKSWKGELANVSPRSVGKTNSLILGGSSHCFSGRIDMINQHPGVARMEKRKWP